jgi:flagellar M-ring protein FliF
VKELLAKVGSQTRAVWLGLTPRGRIGVIGGMSLFIMGLILFVCIYSNNGSYSLLYSQLQTDDAAEVVEILQDSSIPYQLKQNGTEIWIPTKKVLETRLQLAAQGVPRGGVVGFESFNESTLGLTDFERQVRYQRALEGELTRTIREFDQVQDVRVHIVLPEKSLFVGRTKNATAAVNIRLKPGMTLTTSQVGAIIHLVASSVEDLPPENVTIVDTKGNLLSDTYLSSHSYNVNELVTSQLTIKRNYEQALQNDIQEMLEQVYGYGKVIAQVNAEIDFNEVEQYQELYSSPIEESKTGLLRSQQIVDESSQGGLDPGGVAGVYSNIPGYSSLTAPYEQYHREEINNYDLNKTVITTKQAPGKVLRLNVAVIIDGQLDEEDITAVTKTVSAISGIDPNRGDVVNVQSMPFNLPEVADYAPPAAEVSLLPYLLPLLLIGLPLVGLVIFLVGRHKAAIPAVLQTAASVEEKEEISTIDSADLLKKNIREELERIAHNKPEEVARLISVWMSED